MLQYSTDGVVVFPKKSLAYLEIAVLFILNVLFSHIYNCFSSDIIFDAVIDIITSELSTDDLAKLCKHLDVHPYICSPWCKCLRDLAFLLKEKKVRFDELLSALRQTLNGGNNLAYKRILKRLGAETLITIGDYRLCSIFTRHLLFSFTTSG